MNALPTIIAAAKRAPKRIVLPEGEDLRIVAGALRAAREGLAKPVLLGRKSVVLERLKAAGAAADDIEIVDPATSPLTEGYAAAFHDLRKHKGVDRPAAKAAMSDPLTFAAMMVRQGDADGSLGGAVSTTADTVRNALQVIGRAEGITTVSSFFLMVFDQPYHSKRGSFIFSDCGLVVDPDAAQLADIALSSAASYLQLVKETPKLALLSFSTKGSAQHARVSVVTEAVQRIKAARPDLAVDGELQFDAAFVPEIAATKAPGSPVAGDANVFIFPNLEAGNIAYKIAQRIGGATAIGPVLQGLAKPANDLSRGCTAEDVYHMIAVTGGQAAG